MALLQANGCSLRMITVQSSSCRPLSLCFTRSGTRKFDVRSLTSISTSNRFRFSELLAGRNSSSFRKKGLEIPPLRKKRRPYAGVVKSTSNVENESGAEKNSSPVDGSVARLPEDSGAASFIARGNALSKEIQGLISSVGNKDVVITSVKTAGAVLIPALLFLVLSKVFQKLKPHDRANKKEIQVEDSGSSQQADVQPPLNISSIAAKKLAKRRQRELEAAQEARIWQKATTSDADEKPIDLQVIPEVSAKGILGPRMEAKAREIQAAVEDLRKKEREVQEARLREQEEVLEMQLGLREETTRQLDHKALLKVDFESGSRPPLNVARVAQAPRQQQESEEGQDARLDSTIPSRPEHDEVPAEQKISAVLSKGEESSPAYPLELVAQSMVDEKETDLDEGVRIGYELESQQSEKILDSTFADTNGGKVSENSGPALVKSTDTRAQRNDLSSLPSQTQEGSGTGPGGAIEELGPSPKGPVRRQRRKIIRAADLFGEARDAFTPSAGPQGLDKPSIAGLESERSVAESQGVDDGGANSTTEEESDGRKSGHTYQPDGDKPTARFQERGTPKGSAVDKILGGGAKGERLRQLFDKMEKNYAEGKDRSDSLTNEEEELVAEFGDAIQLDAMKAKQVAEDLVENLNPFERGPIRATNKLEDVTPRLKSGKPSVEAKAGSPSSGKGFEIKQQFEDGRKKFLQNYISAKDGEGRNRPPVEGGSTSHSTAAGAAESLGSRPITDAINVSTSGRGASSSPSANVGSANRNAETDDSLAARRSSMPHPAGSGSTMPHGTKRQTRVRSDEFRKVYEGQENPEDRALLDEIGQDLDHWVTEDELQLNDLTEQEREEFKDRLQWRQDEKLARLEHERDTLGLQAFMHKYSESHVGNSSTWWASKKVLYAILLERATESGTERALYALNVVPELEASDGTGAPLDQLGIGAAKSQISSQPDDHVVAFESRRDALNMIHLLLRHTFNGFEEFRLDVQAFSPSDVSEMAKGQACGLTVVHSGEIPMNVDQSIADVEQAIALLGWQQNVEMTNSRGYVDLDKLF